MSSLGAFQQLLAALVLVLITTTLLVDSNQIQLHVLWRIPGAVLAVSVLLVLGSWVRRGGSAWTVARAMSRGQLNVAPGPRGWPVLGSFNDMIGTSHRKLSDLARRYESQGGRSLMSFSVGCTRFVVTCDPAVAKEMLRSPSFAERPLKQAAEELHFERAMGFAPPDLHWKRLRRISAVHLFSATSIAAQHESRQKEVLGMLNAVYAASATFQPLLIRPILQRASINNMTSILFGHRCEVGAHGEGKELEAMINEGLSLLGAFDWADHMPLLRRMNILSSQHRCKQLMSRVTHFFQTIIDARRCCRKLPSLGGSAKSGDFLDVLLALENDDKLPDSDIVSILWEMIFRGTDTIATLTEWALAEMVLHPGMQQRAQAEIESKLGTKTIPVHDKELDNLIYLQAVIKETLRMHPPGPLLSWARLATEDVNLAGFDVPKGTSAMVNMWAITHDASIWPNPETFEPRRFLKAEGGEDVDIRGGDLRLAPFGAGRRVCPGRSLGFATAELWLASLLQNFTWSVPPGGAEVDLSEELKLSCQMASPLQAIPTPRASFLLHTVHGGMYACNSYCTTQSMGHCICTL